jgi:ubiquinone/menaquinone biosynthesis C-methylase UbiE
MEYLPTMELSSKILSHYEENNEQQRLSVGTGQLEFERTKELITRHLPKKSATILDVGGAAGVYSLWLAGEGHEVHLVDPVPFLLEQAKEASAAQKKAPIKSITLGDARRLEFPQSFADMVLLMGPMYHLVEKADRLTALREAYRVLKKSGLLISAAISKFASTLDGFVQGYMDDPKFVDIAAQDLADGQHRNPFDNLSYFTTAFFHHPEELKEEIEGAGFTHQNTFAVEGFGWMLQNFEDHWNNPKRRERLLRFIRSTETEPSMIGVSAHLLAVAKKV